MIGHWTKPKTVQNKGAKSEQHNSAYWAPCVVSAALVGHQVVLRTQSEPPPHTHTEKFPDSASSISQCFLVFQKPVWTPPSISCIFVLEGSINSLSFAWVTIWMWEASRGMEPLSSTPPQQLYHLLQWFIYKGHFIHQDLSFLCNLVCFNVSPKCVPL